MGFKEVQYILPPGSQKRLVALLLGIFPGRTWRQPLPASLYAGHRGQSLLPGLYKTVNTDVAHGTAKLLQAQLIQGGVEEVTELDIPGMRQQALPGDRKRTKPEAGKEIEFITTPGYTL